MRAVSRRISTICKDLIQKYKLKKNHCQYEDIICVWIFIHWRRQKESHGNASRSSAAERMPDAPWCTLYKRVEKKHSHIGERYLTLEKDSFERVDRDVTGRSKRRYQYDFGILSLPIFCSTFPCFSIF